MVPHHSTRGGPVIFNSRPRPELSYNSCRRVYPSHSSPTPVHLAPLSLCPLDLCTSENRCSPALRARRTHGTLRPAKIILTRHAALNRSFMEHSVQRWGERGVFSFLFASLSRGDSGFGGNVDNSLAGLVSLLPSASSEVSMPRSHPTGLHIDAADCEMTMILKMAVRTARATEDARFHAPAAAGRRK